MLGGGDGLRGGGGGVFGCALKEKAGLKSRSDPGAPQGSALGPLWLSHTAGTTRRENATKQLVSFHPHECEIASLLALPPPAPPTSSLLTRRFLMAFCAAALVAIRSPSAASRSFCCCSSLSGLAAAP